MVYHWYYDTISPETSDTELLDFLEELKKSFYPHEDVYFRKANFVYRFFSPYLVNEECIVTKDMVHDLLARTDKVIAAAKAEGVITQNDEVDERFFIHNFPVLDKDAAELESKRVEKEKENMPREWTKVAEAELPTTDGFFFGSTEYGVYYLQDILSCKKQFEKLLADWKDDEVVYNIMSW